MARSHYPQSLAEQTEQLLQQTSTIFPALSNATSGPPPVFNHLSRGWSTGRQETPRKLDIKQETNKESSTRSKQHRRHKQTNPKRTNGYKSRSTSDDLGESGLGARNIVSRGVQCKQLTTTEPPGASQGAARGGVTVRMIPSWDPRSLSREFLRRENKKMRMTVIKKNIWSKL